MFGAWCSNVRIAVLLDRDRAVLLAFSPMANRWGRRIAVVSAVAGLLTIGAVAVSVMPFADAGVSCGAPVVAAVHGKTVVFFDENNANKLKVLTKDEQTFLSQRFFDTLTHTYRHPP